MNQSRYEDIAMLNAEIAAQLAEVQRLEQSLSDTIHAGSRAQGEDRKVIDEQAAEIARLREALESERRANVKISEIVCKYMDDAERDYETAFDETFGCYKNVFKSDLSTLIKQMREED